MPPLITPTQFTQRFISAYMQMDYACFVRVVLCTEPREGDSWQREKFEIFQTAAQYLARLSIEHIKAIIAWS